MEIFKLGEDGKEKPVMFGVGEKDLDAVFRALPAGKYFYWENGTRMFNEKDLDSVRFVLD